MKRQLVGVQPAFRRQALRSIRVLRADRIERKPQPKSSDQPEYPPHTQDARYAFVFHSDNWSVSLRGEHLWRTDYDGADPAANNLLISTNVEEFRGGYWYNLGIGTQVMAHGHYFNFEVVPTITQDLNGIQLETDYSVIASWSKAW